MEQVIEGMPVADGMLQELVALRARSIHDTRTSAYNRRHFEQQVGVEWRRSRRSRSPVTVMMLDIDGRDDTADPSFAESLERVASVLLRQCVRAGDVVARYDGTRFALLLPNTDVGGAEMLARRVCDRVRRAGIGRDSRGNGGLTVSVGIATAASPAALGGGSAALVLRAQRALREARECGGNGYRVAAPVTATVY